MFPPNNALTICFAHVAYQMKTTFDALDTGIHSFEVRSREECHPARESSPPMAR